MRSTYWRAEASDSPALMLVRASRTSSTVAARSGELGQEALGGRLEVALGVRGVEGPQPGLQ
jgi:hypothetical protein